MTPSEAIAKRDRLAFNDARNVILASLIGGAAMRGAFGLYGLNARNIRRKREREAVKPDPGEVELPAKEASWADLFSAKVPRPWWFVPATTIGPAAGLVGGWAGMGALMKKYRKHREREELRKAKEEFEAALEDERSSKFASDLNELASAYVNGELDDDLEKSATFVDWAGDRVKYIGPTLATLALLSGGIGVTGGWALRGNSGQQAKIKAYREAMRRKRISRPSSLMARPAATSTQKSDESDKSDKLQDSESTEKSASISKVLRGVGKYVGIPAASAVGGGLLMTETPVGKWYLKNRMNRLLQDDEFVDNTINQVLTNPEVKRQFSRRLMPAMYQNFMQSHPTLSRIAKFINPSFREQANRGFVA